jgi:hypothetical protein
MPVRQYDPSKVVVTFGGAILSGFADTIFAASRSEDTWSTVVGADGRVSRIRNLNQSGEVTISLHHTSPSNDFLSGVAVDDEALGNGVMQLTIKDHQGESRVDATNAWVKKLPDMGRAKDVSTVEWVISCDRLIIRHTGSAEAAGV